MAKGKRVNPILERARDHFASLDGQSIEVSEWGDDDGPLVVFFDPMTLREKSRLYRMAKNDDMALLAHAVIMKAADGSGNKLFTLEDKHALMNKVDPNILARIANRIIGANEDDTEKK